MLLPGPAHAGRALAEALRGLRRPPRGARPGATAWRRRRRLRARAGAGCGARRLLFVRNFGVPGAGELAMGAVASDGTRVVDARIVAELAITEEAIAGVAAQKKRAAAARADLPQRPRDDRRPRAHAENRRRWAADRSSMRVAVLALGAREPEKLVVAVPVAHRARCREELRALADEVVSLHSGDALRWGSALGLRGLLADGGRGSLRIAGARMKAAAVQAPDAAAGRACDRYRVPVPGYCGKAYSSDDATRRRQRHANNINNAPNQTGADRRSCTTRSGRARWRWSQPVRDGAC